MMNDKFGGGKKPAVNDTKQTIKVELAPSSDGASKLPIKYRKNEYKQLNQPSRQKHGNHNTNHINNDNKYSQN